MNEWTASRCAPSSADVGYVGVSSTEHFSDGLIPYASNVARKLVTHPRVQKVPTQMP